MSEKPHRSHGRLGFEHYSQPVLSPSLFLRRLVRHGRLALLVLVLSLALGMLGYHWLGGLSWMDAFLNASMILTGMGPVDAMTSPAAKLFAGCYALYSGVAFLTAIAVLFAPVLHRALHRFHLEQ